MIDSYDKTIYFISQELKHQRHYRSITMPEYIHKAIFLALESVDTGHCATTYIA